MRDRRGRHRGGAVVRAGAGPAPFAIALPLALLPVPLLVVLVLWMDRLEPEPRGNLVFAFGWGAGIAALTALIVNTADLEYVTMPALGASTGEYVAATFGAPVVEETLKGLVVIGLICGAAASSTARPTASSTRRWSASASR